MAQKGIKYEKMMQKSKNFQLSTIIFKLFHYLCARFRSTSLSRGSKCDGE